jgi:hypothetical protein
VPRTKPKFGDVYEIVTPDGLAYMQYTHESPRFGSLIRVLPDVFETRPDDLEALASRKERFNAFFPLEAASKQGIAELAGTAPVPEEAREFPTFRSGRRNPDTGEFGTWWLWDGEDEWRVDELTDEQRDLSPRGIVNDTRLIERIVGGWTPRDFG